MGVIKLLTYLQWGLWAAKRCVLSGLIVFIASQGFLMLIKKRTPRQYKEFPKMLLVAEFLLSVYICTIIDITGILGGLQFAFSPSNLLGFFSVPFVGASIKMVTLNFLLFVPYGFLVFFCFRDSKLNWFKALLIGFITSLLIECTQAFTGRMTEIDDLLINTAGYVAGYLVAEGFHRIIVAKTRKRGILQCLLTILASVLLLFLLSFIANGDALQAEEDAYYNDIASPGGTRDEELAVLTALNVYIKGNEYDVLNNENSIYDTLYTDIGMDISNRSSLYAVEEYKENDRPQMDKEKIYFEIKYSEPQTFRFYSNREWVMSDVEYMLYCADEGELWYGASEKDIHFHAYYDSNEYPYEKDEMLMDDLDDWLKNQ